jgi:molybdate transport system substrate-binding protein
MGRRLAAILLAALALAGCGSADGDDGPPLTVSAASSLTEAFEDYGELLPGEQRFSFAGSHELAAQIRQGARPDVYAAANTAYPEQLAAEGLVSEPVVFARNRLVVIAAPDSGIESIEDLAEPGLDLVICAAGVPCGDYARELLDRMPGAEREAILANVRAEESDVKGVVGKVAQGAAGAGIVYASDAAAAGDLEAIEIPASLEPAVAYGIAVVAGAPEPEAARRFIDGLTRGGGSGALAGAGFLPPP